MTQTEILNRLIIDKTTPTEAIREITSELTLHLGNVFNLNSYCRSFVLVGGSGFGSFSLPSSDIDSWVILSNLSIENRLKVTEALNTEFNAAKKEIISHGLLCENNFRHPPTFLTEEESAGYRTAFAAKVGLPMYLGVFPTLLGEDRTGELCFTEEQLVHDLAYSCTVFQKDLLNPPQRGPEDPLRYCYKRTSYFLRFLLLYSRNLYIPNQLALLDACEEMLPRWKNIAPILKRAYLYAYEGLSRVELANFQNTVNELMQMDMDEFESQGILDQDMKAKGNVRTKLFWTLEKVRWDTLLLEREARVVKHVMSVGYPGSWGFSFVQINALFEQAFSYIPNTNLLNDWKRFRGGHMDSLSELKERELVRYYENIYLPEVLKFFDNILPFVGYFY